MNIDGLKINDLQKRIAEIEAEIKRMQGEFRLIEPTLKIRDAYIAQLERQNELLLKYAWNTEGEHAICRGCGAPQWLDEHFIGCDVFAAIDGGALEEGE